MDLRMTALLKDGEPPYDVLYEDSTPSEDFQSFIEAVVLQYGPLVKRVSCIVIVPEETA